VGTGSDILALVGEGKKATGKGPPTMDARTRRYPWARRVEDVRQAVLDKAESAGRCTYVACCVSGIPGKP